MTTTPRLTYPTAPTGDQVDEYHGHRIADPYRPLEDADAPATRTWIAAQNALTDQVLAAAPARDAIRARLGELWNFPRAGAPWRRGDRWFQLRNSGLQDQDVLWTASTPDGEGTVVLDPNGLGRDGTTTLSAAVVSESGELVACAISDAGSDWRTWTVRRVATGDELPDRIPWAKFAEAAWTADDAGFFYGRFPQPPAGAAYDAPNRDMELRYHRIGTPTAEDRLVFATPEEPEWTFEPEVFDDGRLLVISVYRGTDPVNRVFVADLTDGVEAAVVRPVIDVADAHFVPIGTAGGRLYLETDRDAPLGRVIAVNPYAAGAIEEIVPEGEDALEFVQIVGDRLAAVYLHDAHNRLALFELDGRAAGEVALPGLGMVAGLAGRRADDTLYLTFMTFLAPPAVLAVKMADGSVRTVGIAGAAVGPGRLRQRAGLRHLGRRDAGAAVPQPAPGRRGRAATSGRSCTATVGSRSPPVRRSSPNGSPGWSAAACSRSRRCAAGPSTARPGTTPGASPTSRTCSTTSPPVPAGWPLPAWTRPERIGISGRSNGGLLVGASITQHPELFGAAIAEVGVMDMLRFHQFTIGWGWTSDYGSPDDPDDFRTLFAYSPLHNCRPGCVYPPTLVTTGDHDDRVVPGHSFKFAAALQAAQAGEAPILIRVDTDAGHGMGKPVSKLIDERTDVLAFLELALG